MPAAPTRPAPAVLDFARRLLRAETLQALAARLAEVRQALSGGAAQPLFARYCQLTYAVASLLGTCLTLATVTSEAAGEAGGAAPSAAAAAAAAAEEEHQAAAEECYRSELAAALRSSYISEHIAATTLALLRAFDGSCGLHASGLLYDGDPSTGPHKAASTAVCYLLLVASDYTIVQLQVALEPLTTATSLPAPSPGQQPSPPLAALRRATALGPCASYLTLAYGMSMLSYMDGGGTRGLPEDVARALGERLRSEARGRLHELAGQGSVLTSPPRHAGSILPAVWNLSNALHAAAVAACAASLAAQSGTRIQQPLAHPPASGSAGASASAAAATTPAATAAITPPRRLQLCWHTALGLAMRAARMGVRAAEEAAAGRTREQEAAALTAALEGRGTFRVLLGEDRAAAVAVKALAVASRLRTLLLLKCRGVEGGGPASDAGSAGGSQADQGAEWWRLMARVAHHVSVMRIGIQSSAKEFGTCIGEHLPTVSLPPDPLPPVPPPAVASALAGGVLPCLERLIRRAAAAAPGDAGAGQGSPELLALWQLVDAHRAHSNPTGWVWSWFSPLLAYGNPRQAGALIATLGKSLSASTERLLNDILHEVSTHILLLGRTWLDDAAARLEGGGALTPPERQLAGLLGAAAAAWLPEVSRRIWSALRAGRVDKGNVLVGVRWLPLLSFSGGATAHSAAAAAASRGPAMPAADARANSDGGWASFGATLFEYGPLLRLSFDAWSSPSMDARFHDALTPWLAEAACTFAALCPEEAAAGLGSVFWTDEVRALASELKAGRQAEAAEALAAQLVRWERGGGARGGGRGGGRVRAASATPLAERYGVWVPRLRAAAALLPASPAAARQLLGGCSNPACANLEGDSDAALPLRACAGCGGAASFCSRECQTAHWRSGHREACGGGAGGGRRGGGGG
ncbi:hypothetical protein HYH03_018183 [Edaphochlamys debaryana]|uniref:phytol kinase n=1 Tax=Edaphochlamys debaryana TaxID=47281 RepID=A0A835XIF9_9CHLO|nr:hypothetical protein HYH03_018183 [Edaphochlamys debaryana]|eukprot:KAG2482901.1 hypothetical protein HYH03_018183 [Edaphochlamys debaryana]